MIEDFKQYVEFSVAFAATAWPALVGILVAAAARYYYMAHRHSWAAMSPARRATIVISPVVLPVAWMIGVFDPTEPLPPPKEESAASFAPGSTATLTIRPAIQGAVPFDVQESEVVLTYQPTSVTAYGTTHTYYQGRCGFIFTYRCKHTDLVRRAVKVPFRDFKQTGPAEWQVQIAENLRGIGAYSLTDIQIFPCKEKQCKEAKQRAGMWRAYVIASNSTGVPASVFLQGETAKESVILSYTGQELQLQAQAWLLLPSLRSLQTPLDRGLISELEPEPYVPSNDGPIHLHDRANNSGFPAYWDEKKNDWVIDPLNFGRPFSECGYQGFPDRPTTLRTEYKSPAPVRWMGNKADAVIVVWSEETTGSLYMIGVEKTDEQGNAIDTGRYFFCDGKFLGARRWLKRKHEEKFTWRFYNDAPHEYLYFGHRDDGSWYEDFWNRVGEDAWPGWFVFKPDFNEFKARREEAARLLNAVEKNEWQVVSARRLGD